MNEKDFVLKRVISLLKTLGFEHVRYTHGSDEYGRDIIFVTTQFVRFTVSRL